MNTILDLIDRADTCATPTLIVILYVVGSKMVGDDARLHRWGIRAAAAAFLAYAGYRGMTTEIKRTDDVVFLLLHALVAGGVTLGAAWTLLAVVGFAWRHLVIGPGSKLQQSFTAATQAAHDRQAERDRERQRIAEQQEYARRAPERERSEREAAARKQAEDTIKADAQKRREDARASCELLFGLHAAEIGNRFPREQFDAFVAKYMTDKHAPEDVERRAEQLRALIEQHREQVKPTPKFATIEDLARWFQEQKQRIESLPIEEKSKRMHLVELNQRYAELTSELLQKMKP